MTPANAAIFDQWIAEEIVKAKKVWWHAFMATMLPRELFDEAAAGNYDRARVYTKAEGFSIHEYKDDKGGESQIQKNGIVVGRFRPKLTPFEDHVQLSFEATVLGKQVPVADLTRHLKN